MFKVGEKIIYKRALCRINSIEKNPRTDEDYYCLCPVRAESLFVKVPANNKFNHLRYPISREQSETLIKKMPTIEPLEVNEKLLENAYRGLMKITSMKI